MWQLKICVAFQAETFIAHQMHFIYRQVSVQVTAWAYMYRYVTEFMQESHDIQFLLDRMLDLVGYNQNSRAREAACLLSNSVQQEMLLMMEICVCISTCLYMYPSTTIKRALLCHKMQNTDRYTLYTAWDLGNTKQKNIILSEKSIVLLLNGPSIHSEVK